jgi:pyrroloquinoline quinone (PQQ) biosynthesis protein C
MDYDDDNTVFVIKLKDNAPLNLQSLFEGIRKVGNIVVSYSAAEQKTEMPDIQEKALFISFDGSEFSDYEEILFYSLLYKIAEKFGVQKRDIKTGMNFPCIHDDVEVFSILIKSSQWNNKYDEDYLVETATGRIISNEEADDLDYNYDIDDENDTTYDKYSRFWYTEIVDNVKYDEDEPFFFLSKIFWRKRKEKYEAEAKAALAESDKLWQKIRY